MNFLNWRTTYRILFASYLVFALWLVHHVGESPGSDMGDFLSSTLLAVLSGVMVHQSVFHPRH